MALLNYDPKLPVYAQPDTQAPNATIDINKLQQQTATTIDSNRGTVAGQMRGLLAENSPYLQVARAGALQTAASRGLLNSSMAAGAGEEASSPQAALASARPPYPCLSQWWSLSVLPIALRQ